MVDLGVSFGKPPATVKERYAVVKKMIAHSEYCQSGDNSLEGTVRAVKAVVEEEADDYFVLVVSDANLSRWVLPPMPDDIAAWSHIVVV
jgi:hypothetical protein